MTFSALIHEALCRITTRLYTTFPLFLDIIFLDIVLVMAAGALVCAAISSVPLRAADDGARRRDAIPQSSC
jgi:hypothetical protein